MVFFITLLRAIAACLITNAHYTGIYPTDLIANGGLIGDIIFFAVSGYCLYNVKGNFIRWYSKRVVRCYLPVLVMTAVYMLLGFYSLSEHSALWWYVYPTYYHFVASIVVLYIPFYCIMKIEALRSRIPYVMLAVLAACIIVYLLPIYDKSYYHIDTVREPMIRFLFMESMLLGAYFKQKGIAIEGGFKLRYLLGTVGCFILYFASKILFSKFPSFSYFQILNWFAIFALLYFVFSLFASLEKNFQKLPNRGGVRTVVSYLATITLEIYVVQYVLIDLIRPLVGFPLNWLALTASILAAATVLHFVCKYILKGFDLVFEKIKAKKRT
ncbi:MAG: acyltransferase [Clostridia bacterium]|nr:acyltransferase [Clostridia bacterium]